MNNERTNRSNPAITLLFWTMFVVGGLSLATGMVLPVWQEYRVEVTRRDEANRRLEEVRTQLVALERRIDHLQNDPAYLERVANREFGFRVPPPEESVAIEIVENPASAPVLLEAQNASQSVTAIIDEATQTHPLVRLYLLGETRPIVMGMSAGLLAAAILLLGRSVPARRKRLLRPGELGSDAAPSTYEEITCAAAKRDSRRCACVVSRRGDLLPRGVVTGFSGRNFQNFVILPSVRAISP